MIKLIFSGRTHAFETLRYLIGCCCCLKGHLLCIPHIFPLPAICCNNPYFKNCKLTVLFSNVSFVSKGSVQEAIEAENYDQERAYLHRSYGKLLLFSLSKGGAGGGGGGHAGICSKHHTHQNILRLFGDDGN